MRRKLKPLHQTDSWDRPLYRDEEGNYYCDVRLGNTDTPDIHFKETKDGEPYFRVDPNKITIEES